VRPTPDIAVHRVTWADGVPVDAKRGVRRLEVIVDGWRFELDVESEARAALMDRARRERGTATSGGATEVRAMIPGRVLAVTVAVGDAVEAGQRLLVIEAMKMQNELRAPRSGVVTDVRVAADRTVELGDLLLTIGDAPAPAASGEREPPTGATPTGETDSGAARSR
jgi:biotin carboxyl carrier protein